MVLDPSVHRLKRLGADGEDPVADDVPLLLREDGAYGRADLRDCLNAVCYWEFRR